MRSPFPGTEPYLEPYWGDIHTSLIVYARNQLNAQLPDDLQARVEESAGVEIEYRRARTVYPDVRVVEEPEPWGHCLLPGVYRLPQFARLRGSGSKGDRVLNRLLIGGRHSVADYLQFLDWMARQSAAQARFDAARCTAGS